MCKSITELEIARDKAIVQCGDLLQEGYQWEAIGVICECFGLNCEEGYEEVAYENAQERLKGLFDQ